MTLAPAALPARIPAGASSTTTHSVAEKPRIVAAFRYGSGCGLPFTTSVAVIRLFGVGRAAARKRTSASARVDEVTIVHRLAGRLGKQFLRTRQWNNTLQVFHLAALYDAVLDLVVCVRQVFPNGCDTGTSVCAGHDFLRIEAMVQGPVSPHSGDGGRRVDEYTVHVEQ